MKYIHIFTQLTEEKIFLSYEYEKLLNFFFRIFRDSYCYRTCGRRGDKIPPRNNIKDGMCSPCPCLTVTPLLSELSKLTNPISRVMERWYFYRGDILFSKTRIRTFDILHVYGIRGVKIRKSRKYIFDKTVGTLTIV